MKKTLLLLASVLMSAASFAQSFTVTWEKPTVTNFVDMADDGETTQFLYNVGANGFFAGHNDWNTRASVAEYGDSVRMKALTGGTWNLCCYPAKYTNKNQWLYVSANAWNAQWVDAGNATGNTSYPGTDTWVVTKQENGSYKFTNTGVGADGTIDENNGGDLLNPDVPAAGSPWGVAETCMGETPNTRCYFYDPTAQYIPQVDGEYLDAELAFPEGSAFWDEWRFVSVEEYTNVYIPELERYLAAVNLKEKIEYALGNEIPAADLADYYAVYNNLNSTTEELQEAAAAAYDKGRWPEIKEYFENIEQGEKNDVSGVFVNPDFETGNVDGWDITYTANSAEATNIGYQGREGGYTNGDVTVNKFIEAWKDDGATPKDSPRYLGDGSITQTIPSLPSGKYMLAVDVIANNQGRISDPNNPNGLPDDVQLFAKASLDGKEYYTNMATKNEKPEHFEFTFVHTGGSMTLGLRVINSATAKMPANWICMDNLKLYYYGPVTDDPDKILLDAAIEKAIEEYDPDDLEDIYAYTGHKAAYVTAMESAKQISEEGGDYVAAKEALLLASDTLKLSIAAYGTFEALREEAIEKTEEFDGTKFEGIALVIGDLLQDWDDAYNDGTYTIEQIEGLPNLLAKTINDYVSDNLEAGDNITFMIKNANFDKDFSGWDVTGAIPAWGGINDNTQGTMSDITMVSGDAEVFHKKFSMSQTIYNMPAGLYQFTCQGFSRCDDGSTNEASLYAIIKDEEQSSPLPLITDFATDEQLFSDGTWWSDVTSGGKYIPNGMPGANYHFSHTIEGNELPDYTTTLNVTLEETADVTVGVKCTSEHNWVIFDNFQLVYLGSGSDAYMIAINQKLAELKKYINDNEENIGTDVQDLYDSLLDQSTKLSEDECTAFLGTLDEAIAYAKSSVEVYATADEAMSNLATAVDESDNESAKDAASNFDTTYADAIANRDLTVDGVNAAITTINELIAALNVPGNYNTATDDAPIDMTKCILNADIEQGGDVAWTFTLAKGNGPTKDSGIHTKSMEAWSGTTGAELDFNFFQTLTSLPAGKYKLSANAANSLNGVSEDVTAYNNNTAGTGRAVLYIETSSGTKASTPVSVQEGDATSTYSNYSVIFTLAEGESVNVGIRSVGTMAARWFVADDFELTYYGTESAKTDTDGGPLTGVEEIGVKKVVNGKFFEKGRIFIMRNGVKYNVAGQIIE